MMGAGGLYSFWMKKEFQSSMCTVDDLDNLLLIHKSQLILRVQFKVPADQFQLDLAKEFYIIS